MPTELHPEEKQAREQAENAPHNGEVGCCNWCGAPKKELELETSVFVSDLSRTIHCCDSCGELTAKWTWNGPVYRAAAKFDAEDAPYRYIWATPP